MDAMFVSIVNVSRGLSVPMPLAPEQRTSCIYWLSDLSTHWVAKVGLTQISQICKPKKKPHNDIALSLCGLFVDGQKQKSSIEFLPRNRLKSVLVLYENPIKSGFILKPSNVWPRYLPFYSVSSSPLFPFLFLNLLLLPFFIRKVS